MDNSTNTQFQKMENFATDEKKLSSEIEDIKIFMYSMIHDLKAPISNLNYLFSLIKEEDAAERPALVEKAESVINNMGFTISTLNKLIAYKDSEQEDIETVDFMEILTEIKETEISASLKEITFYQNFNQCPHIRYPLTFLKSIVSNLLNNAVKYRSQNRPLVIHLSSKKLGDSVLFTVRDNGEGINLAEEGKQLFKPFKRLSNSKEGSRLGLYLIKNLAEKNGGHIVVDSTVGVGSTFTLYLKEYK